MPHLLGADRVHLTLGTRTLLDGISLGVDDGQRIGVVGPNGAGKSTLLRVLAGRQDPDGGRVTRLGGTRVALLDQRDDLGPGTVLDAVHGSADAHEWASDAGIRAVHTGLLADVDLDAPLAELSGGQRRRVALAALLVRDDEVLVLDEPTNHLDVEGVAWLASYLVDRYARSNGALVVVTHDRWFLDAVCTRTWEVHDGVVDQYEGGYAAYVLARAERAQQAATIEGKRQNLLRKELAWLRRGAPARTSKPKFRIDAATALIADEPPPRDSLALARTATARLGKDVLDLEDVTYTLPDGRVLLDDVTWRLGPGDRYGVVGVNGAGKTTLLRLLTGSAVPTSGRVRRGKTVRVAELRQDVEDLDEVAGLTVVEAVEREKRTIVVGGKELTAAQLVERLGFTRDRARTLVRELSGGERRRLQLLRLLVSEPNVLLLDEPTNDLDTDTLAAVEDLLDGWPGTLVVVSHDRYLLERVCDRQVALLGDGKVRDLPGGVEEYLQLRGVALAAGAAEARAGGGVGGAAARAGGGAVTSSPAPAPAADAPPAPSAAEVRAARKEVQRIERRLERIAALEADLHTRMAAQATDHAAVLALDAELRALAAERDELEAAWLEAAETAG
ncbi:ABC-F family ATP-binding cassette domain-containing protein [Cellulomonas sp. zg-Y908]|uniref:ABC-F family ATP-binding cassette domain-containing protein n=1 Tax=Cellulomonas wangsupingiae TaxID=2968085 RepID=A0ABY5KA47_9CELL|nr:ABC-F family ATP-binding cassette domain-containing protein [Cellulomonas wangsupingiae]MCC2334317.1 ABC-F family ATP-binding cassette domain-containing protein [Cellulomonas wangsupingiae]UUI65992.1 ABC-F family ATP-binding cassette domain-containing protein [Cellulomonas wangsupingiae]